MDNDVKREPPEAPQPPVRGPLRRLWWLWLTLAVSVTVVVAALVTITVFGVRSVRAGERSDRAYDTAVRACADLETRLNRLAPPGAARSARQRADAVRAENAAVAPFLTEL